MMAEVAGDVVCDAIPINRAWRYGRARPRKAKRPQARSAGEKVGQTEAKEAGIVRLAACAGTKPLAGIPSEMKMAACPSRQELSWCRGGRP